MKKPEYCFCWQYLGNNSINNGNIDMKQYSKSHENLNIRSCPNIRVFTFYQYCINIRKKQFVILMQIISMQKQIFCNMLFSLQISPMQNYFWNTIVILFEVFNMNSILREYWDPIWSILVCFWQNCCISNERKIKRL